MVVKIVTEDLPEQLESEYWEKVANGKKVKPLNKPCVDCAMVNGFYMELAENLKKQPIEIQNRVLDTWYCHNSCNRGCSGIRKFLKDK